MAVVLALLAGGARADTVSLDSSFGSSGIVAVASGETFDALAVQSDGKEIVTGTTGSGSSAMVRRYNRDGSADTSFGANGETTLAVADGTQTAQPQFRGIVVLSSGDIVLVGDVFLSSAGQREIVVVRLTAAGALDTSFGTSGYRLVDVGSTLRSVAAALPTSGGNIVVVTSTGLIAEIDSSGALVASFGTNGVAADTGVSLYNGALQSDGSILVVGENGFGTAGPAIVQRFTSAGVLDTSFGSSGTITTTNDTESCAVATDSQGRIVVAGETSDGWLVVDRRLASDGGLDPSFAASGTLTTSVHLEGAENVRDCSIVTRSDDSILVGGTGSDPSTGATVDLLAHVGADGSLDAEFGSSGFFRTSVGHKNATGLAARSDGSVVQAGQGGMAGYTLTASQAPVAAFTASENALQVSVDASGSTNATSYGWDFGDGSTATGVTASHTYAGAGTHTVTLRVTDSGGATDSVSQQVTVAPLPPANQPPTASFTSSTSGLTGSFDASASSDIDGTIASYNWDFGDGGSGTGATPTHTYGAAGTYTVALTVTDNEGATATVSHDVTVRAAGGSGASSGNLTQLAAPADCIAETNASGCGTTDGAGLAGADWIAVSPDGDNVYVASFEGGIAEFARAADGSLTEIGCISSSSTSACSTSSFTLSEATSVAVSPDGKSVYVTASEDDIINVLDRAADGTLTFASCIQDTGARFDRGCATHVHGMINPYDLVVSDDGANAYVAAGGSGAESGAIVELARGGDGSLSQLASPDDCIEETGSTDGACGTTGTGLLAATALAISPDGTSLYAVADTHAVRSGDAPGAIAEFSRDPSTGALAQLSGSPCIGESTSVSGITECQARTAPGLSDLVNIAISADGDTVYTASDDTDGEIAAFSRANDGSLTSLGCVGGGGAVCGETASGLASSFGLAVSPDGSDVYVAAAGSSTSAPGIVELARAADGTLTGSGCVQQSGAAGGTCGETGGHGLGDALSVAVSPDNANVYTAADSSFIAGSAGNGGAVAAFARAHAAPPANQPPTASFTSSASGLTVSFDGSASSDSDGSIVSYTWDFGDGTTGTSAAPSHTYSAAGTYSATLTVTDDDGATDDQTSAVTVQAPAQAGPQAVFTESAAGLTVHVDGSPSTDDGGSIVRYAWTFGDDSLTWLGRTITHTYAAGGTYTITLTVTDSQGKSATTSKVESAHLGPTADFDPVPGEPGDGPLSVTLDASASTDPDSRITSYAWDFGDGHVGDGVIARHTYAAGGTYTVVLTLTDQFGGTDTESHAVKVPAVFYSLAVARSGNGAGTVGGGSSGIDCGGVCDAVLLEGSVVTLIAQPTPGSMFVSWSGDGGCFPTANACTITITGDTHVTAIFAEEGRLEWRKVYDPFDFDQGAMSVDSIDCPSHGVCALHDSQAQNRTPGGLLCSDTLWLSTTSGLSPYDCAGNTFGKGAVACPSVTLCVNAVAARVKTVRNPFTGPTNTVVGVTDSFGHLHRFSDVSCPTASFCAAVADAAEDPVVGKFDFEAGLAAVWFGGDWAAAIVPGSGDFRSVSCPTTDFCVATDDQQQAFTMSIQSIPVGAFTISEPVWTAHATGIDLGSVSCVSATLCVAIDNDDSDFGIAVSTDPGHGVWRKVFLDALVRDVSCVSPSFCAVLDENGDVFTTTNPTGEDLSSWVHERVTTLPSPIAISCRSTSQANPLSGIYCDFTTQTAAVFEGSVPRLAVATSGSGTVTSDRGSIDCGSTCAATFFAGDAVVLTAAPAPGFVFTGWSGGVCSGRSTCTVTMSSSLQVVANFGQLQTPGSQTGPPSAASDGVATVSAPNGPAAAPAEASRAVAAGVPGTLALSAAANAPTVSWNSKSFARAVVVKLLPAPSVVRGPGGSPGTALQLTVTAQDGSAVTRFAAPLEITFAAIADGTLPAFSIDGLSWIRMPRLRGTTLPAGYRDGWYRDATGAVHVLTLHATYFGLLDRTAKMRAELSATVKTSPGKHRSLVIRLRPTLPSRTALVLRRGSVVLAKTASAIRGSRTFVLHLSAHSRASMGRLTVVVTAGDLHFAKVLRVRLGR